MQKTVSLTVNGKPVSATVEGRTLLVQLLREQLGLTGTHVGCDTSQCGACVVHVDGEAVKACTLLAVQAEGRSVLTIEGVATGDTLHPMQEAFRNNHALQCGFCTPGMVMSALDLVKNNPNPTEREIREYLEGNLCRCTGYHNIVLAIAEGAAVMRGEAPPPTSMGRPRSRAVATIGTPVRRREDYRFLTGAGTYTDDIDRPGQLYAYILRSPHAHARITGIDTAAAQQGAGSRRCLRRQGHGGGRSRRAALRLADPFEGRLADGRAAAPGAGGRPGPLCRRPGSSSHRRDLGAGA